MRASETGTVQGILTSLLTDIAHKAPPAGQVATLAAQVVSGAQTLEQAEAQRLLSSTQAQTIRTLGQQVATGMVSTQMTEDYTREYVMGTPLATIRGEMAALPQMGEYLTAKYFFTYGATPTTAQLNALTGELASGKNLSDVNAQFYAAAGQQVTAAYQQVLGRAPTSAELTSYENQIELAGRPIGWVVNRIASSTEAQTTMQAALQSAFGLPPNPTDVGKLLSMLGQGTPLAQIRTDLASIDTFTIHTTGAAPTSSEVSTMVGQLAAGTPLATIQQNLATSTGTQAARRGTIPDRVWRRRRAGHGGFPHQRAGKREDLHAGLDGNRPGRRGGQAGDRQRPRARDGGAERQAVRPRGGDAHRSLLQQTETATVSITAGLGKLSSGAAQVSADGLRATVTGGAGYVQGVREARRHPGHAGWQRNAHAFRQERRRQHEFGDGADQRGHGVQHR